jgi:hypothetical protein
MVRHGKFGKPSIDLIARKSSMIAQILTAREAVAALIASGTKPGDSNTVSFLESLHVFTLRHHHTDNLVAENERKFRVLQFSVKNMKVRAAYATGPYGNEQLFRTR